MCFWSCLSSLVQPNNREIHSCGSVYQYSIIFDPEQHSPIVRILPVCLFVKLLKVVRVVGSLG